MLPGDLARPFPVVAAAPPITARGTPQPPQRSTTPGQSEGPGKRASPPDPTLFREQEARLRGRWHTGVGPQGCAFMPPAPVFGRPGRGAALGAVAALRKATRWSSPAASASPTQVSDAVWPADGSGAMA